MSQVIKPGWLISQRYHKWVGRLQSLQVTYGTYSGLPWVSDLPDSLRAGQSLCRWINLNRRREKRFREDNWTRTSNTHTLCMMTCTQWCILSSSLKSVLQLLWWWCSRSTRTTWQHEAQTGQKPSPGLSCAPSGLITHCWSHVGGYCVRHRQAFVFWILIVSVSKLFQSWKASVK